MNKGTDNGQARPQWRGRLKMDEEMARHTSWKVGGMADRFYIPRDPEDLAAFLASLPEDEPLVWIGLGSNVLVRDGGIRGTVISLNGMKQSLRRLDAGALLAGSGSPCAKVARFSARAGLTGGEFLAGIPGSIGGALAMNAGAFGAEIWDVVEGVETITRQGERRQRPAADFVVGYRQAELAPERRPEDEWFLSARLRFEQDADGQAEARIRELLTRRNATQPLGQFSCGSVFRNPPNDFAARLIQECGLKGFALGGARVSEKHANFIINDGRAKAREIETLIRRVQEKVADRFGVTLVPEVKILGEAARH